MIIGFAKEAFRHGYTHEDYLYAAAHYPYTTKLVDLGESRNRNSTATLVGYIENGNLMEYCIEYLEEMIWVYHMNRPTPENEKKFHEAK